MARKINTIKDLSEDLIECYKDLRSGGLSEKSAKEISNMAGKILGSLKIRLEYEIYKPTIGQISFLETEENEIISGNDENQLIGNEKVKNKNE